MDAKLKSCLQFFIFRSEFLVHYQLVFVLVVCFDEQFSEFFLKSIHGGLVLFLLRLQNGLEFPITLFIFLSLILLQKLKLLPVYILEFASFVFKHTGPLSIFFYKVIFFLAKIRKIDFKLLFNQLDMFVLLTQIFIPLDVEFLVSELVLM